MLSKKLPVFLIAAILWLLAENLAAQNTPAAGDSIKHEEKISSDKISLLVYIRTISDASGNKRMDENVVGNFRLVRWLKLEAGFRQGERPGAIDSYYQYKLELQTKYFWKSVRVFARLSDNVLNYPSPSYRKTNRLFVAEAKYPLLRVFQVSGGLGYILSSQQDRVPDALPTFEGVQTHSPLFKIALRYILKNKSFVEMAYGTYDVFNSYSLNQPFIQVATEQKLTELCDLFAFFRYQYNNGVFTPFNYFLAVGIKFHLVKD